MEVLRLKYCEKCGNQIPDSVQFCPSCGGKQSGNQQKKEESVLSKTEEPKMSDATPEPESLLHEGEQIIMQYPAIDGRSSAGEGLLTLTNERLLWQQDDRKTKKNAVKGAVFGGVIYAVAAAASGKGSNLVILPLSDIDSYQEPKKIFGVGAAINFIDKKGKKYNFMLKKSKKISGEAAAEEFMNHIKAMLAK